MYCTCSRNNDGSRHHHAFGGTYPCEGPGVCDRCRPDVPAVEFLAPAWPDDDYAEEAS